jgi:hypothetical protein
MYKNISAQMSDEAKKQVIQKLKEVESLLPFIVDLSPDEIRSLPKLGRKSLKFVESALNYARQHPNFIPPYLDMNEQERDLQLTRQLVEILEVLNPLSEKVNDTCYAVGAEAYAAARVFYTSIKGAVKTGVPGVDVIARDLGRNFEKSGYAPRKNEEEKKEELG